jgi:putative FmdB family regulatory protein
MPDYEHMCNQCKHEWEESYSIKADPPKFCPACNAEDVTRLISLGGKGVVELTGQELVDKVKSDIKTLKRDAHSNEKVYSNLLGEAKYQTLQTKIDQRKRDGGRH